MKALYPTLVLVLAFLTVGQLSAQPNKIDGALHSFLNSDFMVRMKDMKIEAEAAVRTFKQQSTQLDPEAVKRVRVGYDQTAARFNQLLTNIKTDFLNPKKLKFISKFPDDYLKGLELELYHLSDFYAQNFQQPLADAQAQDVDGAAAFLILSELIGLTKGLFNYFGQIKNNSRQYNESYLQQHLIKPYRFRFWDEINQGGAYDAYQDNFDQYRTDEFMDVTDPNSTFPATDTEFPAINLPTLEQQFQPQDQYQQTDTYDDWLDQNAADQDTSWIDDPNFQPGTAPVDSTRQQPPSAPNNKAAINDPKKQQAKKRKKKN